MCSLLDKTDHQQINQVFAYAKGSIDTSPNIKYEKAKIKWLDLIEQDKKEVKKLLRKHWWDRWINGISEEKIYEMYGRNRFGKVIN